MLLSPASIRAELRARQIKKAIDKRKKNGDAPKEKGWLKKIVSKVKRALREKLPFLKVAKDKHQKPKTSGGSTWQQNPHWQEPSEAAQPLSEAPQQPFYEGPLPVFGVPQPLVDVPPPYEARSVMQPFNVTPEPLIRYSDPAVFPYSGNRYGGYVSDNEEAFPEPFDMIYPVDGNVWGLVDNLYAVEMEIVDDGTFDLDAWVNELASIIGTSSETTWHIWKPDV
ncbi:hypothetical protein AJ79_09858 [Helicocarpus griseus UAMH5409]|uniref:Uncharacterized protein n=1 Tax=Helicocarpus griseus UAMH5409 TaxID=1447875 RepID=A0A2B7WH31_9EURO|nr:hypothetical protein AJ79_09858 [Helicocarpus griseus UAMH5409]